MSLPLLLHPLVGVLCVAIVGIGICGVGYGLAGAWNSLENVCAKSFSTFNPLRVTRLRVQSLVQKIAAKPLMQKLHRVKKTAENPLESKFLNSPIARARHGLTPRQRDVFLSSMTIEGSLAAIAYCAHSTAVYIAALPLFTVGGIVTLGMGAAAYVIGTGVFDLYCSAKTLKQSYRDRKNAKKSVTAESVPEPVPAAIYSPGINARPMPANTAAAFNEQADKSVKKVVPVAAAPSFAHRNPVRRRASRTV